MDFGAAEHIRYKHIIFPIFADFLRKCYSEFPPYPINAFRLISES